RNAASSNRKRRRIFVRDVAATDASAFPGSAMSANFLLPASTTFGYVPQFDDRRESHSPQPGAPFARRRRAIKCPHSTLPNAGEGRVGAEGRYRRPSALIPTFNAQR